MEQRRVVVTHTVLPKEWIERGPIIRISVDEFPWADATIEELDELLRKLHRARVDLEHAGQRSSQTTLS